MPITVYQQILRGPKSNNRAFRYRRLKPSELDNLDVKAAKILATKGELGDARMDVLRQIRIKEGIREMLVAVTRQPVPVPEPLPPAEGAESAEEDEGVDASGETKPRPPPPEPPEPALDDPKLWWEVERKEFITPGSEFHFDELFSASDNVVLKTVFLLNHEALLGDVDNVVKKERTVSTG
jgi:hypothetical protein